ncbi:hypothetical protein [Nocardioides sp.]|uniref:hypothetical protein n=1 Tax=Nocardioides sp. TaxID=35761 RepID=UPI003784257F
MRRRLPRRTVLRQLPADAVFNRGKDAVVVLVLRCYRSFSMVLVGLGACIATWAHSVDDLDQAFVSPEAIMRALVTPLAALAVGIVVRASVTPLAWGAAMAFVAVTNPEMTPPPRRDTAWTRLSDQARMASAYRPLRWTTSVRDAAVESLGRTGSVLQLADAVLRALAVLAWLAFVVLLALR